MNKNNVDINELLEKASKLSIDNFEVQDLEKDVLDLFKKVFEEYGDTWVLGTQVINKFKPHTTIGNKLERLVNKGLLESRYLGNRRVYRLKVTS